MKIKIMIAFLFCTTFLKAQEFKGIAIYKTSKKDSHILKDTLNKRLTKDVEEKIQSELQKKHQKTFVLNFDKTASLYKEDTALKVPTVQSNSIKVYKTNSNVKLYKNLKEKRFVNQKEVFGKIFLIKDHLKPFDWKLTSETKKIGNYTCYKAYFNKKIKRTIVTEVDGVSQKVQKNEILKTIAWYTPEIAINTGPGKYHGLPGLILEVNDGNTIVLCTELIVNPSKNIEIKEPKNGKKVSANEFRSIYRDKMKEMKEMKVRSKKTRFNVR